MQWDFSFPPETTEHALAKARVFTHRAGAATAPTVLFIPGGFHGAWAFAPYMRALAGADVSSAALDLRGHGGLPQDAGFIAAGVAAMSADVAAAAAVVGGGIILAGHSLGALVAMAAARDLRPRALIMLAPAPPGNIPKMHNLPPFPADAPTAPPPEARARRWLLQGLAPGTGIAPYLARLCPESPALLNDRYGGKIIVDPAWIEGPRLCMTGARDTSPLLDSRETAAAAALYGADAIVTPGGHCFMLEDEGTAGQLLGWLKAHALA